EFRDEPEFPEFYSLAHRLFKNFFFWLCRTLVALTLMLAGFWFFSGTSSSTHVLFFSPEALAPFTISLLLALAWHALVMAKSERLRELLYRGLVSPSVIGMVAGVAWLLLDQALTPAVRISLEIQSLVLAAALAFLVGLRRMYYNIEYTISSISPSTAQSVLALHEALYKAKGENRAAVLQSIDRHVGGVRGRKRGLLNFPFALIEFVVPLFIGVPIAFSSMSSDERRYLLRKKILRPPAERRRALIPALAELVYKLGNAVHALVTLAHYSHPKARHEIGYIPADARDRLQGDYPSSPPPFASVAPLPDGPSHPANFKPQQAAPARPLTAPRVVTPVSEPEIPDDIDYLVVGSGAGGAVAAYRLACGKGVDPQRVLVVERGPRYSPLQDFNDDEMEMVRKLYKEGGLQQTRRFDLIVLQGECVGGTTVVNNAVCFPMPDRVRRVWRDEYDIDLSGLDEEYRRIADEIEIEKLPDSGINQRVKEKFLQGVQVYNQSLQEGQKLIEQTLKTNSRNEYGDGLWNIGNKRMRKRSMLETYIPWAEARGVRVISETSAVRFFAEGRRATSVLLRSDLGNMKRVAVRKAVIIAGGVIASSHFLMRSGVKGMVGKGMSCNFAFPVALEFPDRLDAFDGVQITLGALDPDSRAVFETYFNPPGSFAISVPFYFDRLQRTMDAYSKMANFGALVGSEAGGSVEEKADWIDGRAFDWSLGPQDRDHIKYALSTLVELGNAAGAVRAVLPLEPGIDLPLNAEAVRKFQNALRAYPLRQKDLRLTTAHPQGGNRMIGDRSPHWQSRVVNGDFRVEGFDNVLVADASLFPTGITINPQWTIMALSSMAAQKV
ncbi:MAG: GMC family oxidoreductase N-terminal domain-containing protein, partial [Bacteroidota bacterium]